jgi:hypothetical protein
MLPLKYGFTVFVIVMDGSVADPKLDDLKKMFGTVQSNNGISAVLNVETTPALMAFNQDTQEVIPLSYAAVSLDKLEDQVMTLSLGDF